MYNLNTEKLDDYLDSAKEEKDGPSVTVTFRAECRYGTFFVVKFHINPKTLEYNVEDREHLPNAVIPENWCGTLRRASDFLKSNNRLKLSISKKDQTMRH